MADPSRTDSLADGDPGSASTSESDSNHRHQHHEGIDQLTERLLATIPTGILVFDADGIIRLVNDRAQEILGASTEGLVGCSDDAPEFDLSDPNGEPLAAEEMPIERVRNSGEPVFGIEVSVRRSDGDRVWLSVNAAPLRDGEATDDIVVSIEDITERKRREEREQFLLDLSDRIRTLQSSEEIGEICTRLLAEEMGLDRAYFVRFFPDEDEALVGPEYHSPNLDPVSGSYPFSAFPEAVQQIQTETPVYDDVATDSRLPEAEKQALSELDFGAWIGVPVRIEEGKADWGLYAATSEPHDWTDGEVSLVEETAERTWAAVERARAEEELRESEERYRALFESMDEGYAIVEPLPDERGKWDDFLFHEVNPAFEDHTGVVDATGRKGSEILGTPNPAWAEIYGRVAETGEPERFEQQEETLEKIFDLYAFRLGGEGSRRVAVLFTDITERKERERRLANQREQIETLQTRLLDTSPTGILVMNSAGEITLANDRVGEILGLDGEEIVGLSHDAPEFGIVDSDGESIAGEELPFERALRNGEAVFDIEVGANGPDGGRVWLSVNVAPIYEDGDDEPTEFVVTFEDITERRSTEEALRESEERFRALVTTTSDVVYRMSPDWSEMHELEGGGFLADTDEPSQTWVDEYIPDDEQPRVREAIDDAIETKSSFELEHRVVREDDTTGWTVSRATPLLDEHGEIREWFGAANDTTERKRANEALTNLNDATRELLDADAAEIADRTPEIAREILDVELASLWRYDGDRGELRLSDTSTDEGTEVSDIEYPEGFDEQAWNAFVTNEMETDNDLSSACDIDSTGEPIRSGVIVPLGRHGVLYAGSTTPDAVDEARVDLAETVAGTIETALNRADHERELAQQNDELTQLNRINKIIREIDQVLVEADTREAITQTVCERLADSDLYEFAWIGHNDITTNRIEPQEWAGVDSSYLDGLTIPTDDSAHGGPLATALQTGKLQVVEDILTDGRFAPWREATLEQGARSCIAIPLVYEDSPYGVLTVYASEPQSNGREHTVLTELGMTIANAIASVETTRTLQTDSVVELDIQIPAPDDVLCRLAQETDCRIEFDGLIPASSPSASSRSDSDDPLQLFFTAHGAPTEAILAAGEASLAFEKVICLTESASDKGSEATFKALCTDSTLPAELLEQDITIRSLTVDSGGALAVINLPATIDPREFIETLHQRYPGVELRARRSREQPTTTRSVLQSAFSERLTNRQQEVLRTAYLSGYFESPRHTTGKELTASLGISQPTFTQHLRAGQRKIFEVLFDESPLTS